MEIPKNVVLKKALEQIDGKIELESATWAGRLAEKVEAEKLFTKKEFSDKQKENYQEAHSKLDGKNQAKYTTLYLKMSEDQRNDFNEISKYKMAEAKVNNAEVHMATALARIDACIEVKELIETSISAQNKL